MKVDPFQRIFYWEQEIVYILKDLSHRPLVLDGGLVRDAKDAEREMFFLENR